MAAFDYPKNEGVAFVEQEELIAIRRQLHQIPEIGLEEKETQATLSASSNMANGDFSLHRRQKSSENHRLAC